MRRAESRLEDHLRGYPASSKAQELSAVSLGRGEWVMYHEKIPVAEYAKLEDRFTAEKFDADVITDLTLEAGMTYVNITSRS